MRTSTLEALQRGSGSVYKELRRGVSGVGYIDIGTLLASALGVQAGAMNYKEAFSARLLRQMVKWSEQFLGTWDTLAEYKSFRYSLDTPSRTWPLLGSPSLHVQINLSQECQERVPPENTVSQYA
ncbi:hypothetical protein M8818_005043 [Zalaria obscura]|uniref:Uncharacterized protein n=1 Tax=Zalaria obscura TaxID=2024903 RepID=A0ACC3S9X3_9PEZI